MIWPLATPQLVPPDADRWDAANVIATGSRAWFELARRVWAPDCRLAWLTSNALRSQGVFLPCLVRGERFGCIHLDASPRNYYVGPVGAAGLSAATFLQICEAGRGANAVFRWTTPFFPDAPELVNRLAKEAPAATRVKRRRAFVIGLEGGYERVFAERINATYRNNIRQAFRQGLAVESAASIEDLKAFHALMLQAHQEQNWEGAPLPWDFFQWSQPMLGKQGDVLIARHEGRLVGGAFFLHDDHCTHYFHGAIDRSSRVHPMKAIIARMLQTACEAGRRWFNFGAVNPGNESLTQFKRAWGAEEQPYLAVQYTGRWARAMGVRSRSLTFEFSGP